LKVSVVIPSYNRYRFLFRAISSVLEQTLSADEIIVVDDGSYDNTSQIQKDFPTIRYFYKNNGGVSSARNLGITHAKNEWIAFLDSDDQWHKEKLQNQVKLHKDNPNILMSYTDEEWFRDHKSIKIPKKFHKIAKDLFLENLSYCNIAPSAVMMHSSLFQKYGLFDENLEVCEDYDLWLRVAAYEKIGLIKKKFLKKHAGHEDQLSFKYWGMDRFRVQSLEKLLSSLSGHKYEQNIKDELQKKYILLLKGAHKHNREEEIMKYEKKLSMISTQRVNIQ
jgi:glycosyltransferase involved in cell wall biosynthesis